MNNVYLGIHYGHNATVAVVQEGELVFCQSEERFNRIKNSTGFPRETLKYVYDNICPPEKVERAILFQKSTRGYLYLKQHNFEPFQYGGYLSPEDICKERFFSSHLHWNISQFSSRLKERNAELRHEALSYFLDELGVSSEKIDFCDHHQAHAYSTFANIHGFGECLVFTLDGVGDDICATVSKMTGGSKLEVVSQVNHYHSLGYYYSAITALMGMKSGEHEFKVMGLAPYASRKYYLPILERMRELLKINECGEFESAIPPSALRDKLGSIIKYQRFDNIAGAIQELTEELIVDWINFWMRKTAIHNVALAGGVFMNVKACQKVMEIPEVERVFVMPSAADESTAIGAAFWGMIQDGRSGDLKPIQDLYLGLDFSDEEIEKALEKSRVSERYEISKPGNINHAVARLLASNEVVARCSGRMEFGARALGNRSILANPKSSENIELINAAIKNRDFWMPFTPSILDVDMSRYIQNPKNVFAPYMCLTFDSTEEAQRDLKAAIHPRDKTVRPQCVLQEWNPDYYEVISEFKNITGIGGVLNTSFNLHGEPNVCTPEDAIHTVDHSGLKYLALGHYLLEEK